MIRIIKASLGIAAKDERGPAAGADPARHELYYDALTLMDEVLLPALSLSECNCCLAEEIWTVLRVYPYHHRRVGTSRRFIQYDANWTEIVVWGPMICPFCENAGVCP